MAGEDRSTRDEHGQFTGSEPEGGGGSSSVVAGAVQTPAAQEAVEQYQWNSGEINGALREGEPLTPTQASQVQAMESAMVPLSQDTLVFRGVMNATGTAPDYANLPVGAGVTEPGFMSATTDRTVGEWISTNVPSDEASGMQMIAVRLPAGTPVIDTNATLGTNNTYGSEGGGEIIAPRGLIMQVAAQTPNFTRLNAVPKTS